MNAGRPHAEAASRRASENKGLLPAAGLMLPPPTKTPSLLLQNARETRCTKRLFRPDVALTYGRTRKLTLLTCPARSPPSIPLARRRFRPGAHAKTKPFVIPNSRVVRPPKKQACKSCPIIISPPKAAGLLKIPSARGTLLASLNHLLLYSPLPSPPRGTSYPATAPIAHIAS